MNKTNIRHAPSIPDRWLDKGPLVLVLGVGLLLAPSVFGSSPQLRAMGEGLHLGGLLTLGLGGVMLAAHLVLTNRKAPHPAAPPAAPVKRGRTDLRTLLPDDPALPASLIDADADEPAGPSSVWSLSVFEDIEWRRFEALCEALFAQAGFQTHVQSAGAAGGAVIWLQSRNAAGPVAIVRCKHGLGEAVGIEEMRQFFGLMDTHKLKRGTFATSGWYTSEALQFARSHGINALDGETLLDLLSHRTPEQQRALLNVAHEGEFWRPTCVRCGIKMVERVPVRGKTPFWGCSRSPLCRFTLPLTGRDPS